MNNFNDTDIRSDNNFQSGVSGLFSKGGFNNSGQSGETDRESKLFYKQLDSYMLRARQGEIAHTGFLNPQQQYFVIDYILNISRSGMCEGRDFIFYGGYSNAQRKFCIFFPEWMDYADIGQLNECASDEISSVFICPDPAAAAKLSHSDYLGALMSLSIKRECMGDIIVFDGHDGQAAGAAVFCTPVISDFLVSLNFSGDSMIEIDKNGTIGNSARNIRNMFSSGAGLSPLQSVGRYKTSVVRCSIDFDFNGGQAYKEINAVSPSMRLDGITALLTGEPRDRSKQMITSGDVSLNYSVVQKPDYEVKPGDILSVRHFGKFRIENPEGRTKKDKIKIRAVKYL